MGTRGYYIYKFKGVYYFFYVQYDAHDLFETILDELSRLSNNDFEEIKQSLSRITSMEDYTAICQSAGFPKKAYTFEGIITSCLHPEKHVIDYIINEFPDSWELEYTDVIVDFDQMTIACGDEEQIAFKYIKE
jgi:hypothetical protein